MVCDADWTVILELAEDKDAGWVEELVACCAFANGFDMSDVGFQ